MEAFILCFIIIYIFIHSFRLPPATAIIGYAIQDRSPKTVIEKSDGFSSVLKRQKVCNHTDKRRSVSNSKHRYTTPFRLQPLPRLVKPQRTRLRKLSANRRVFVGAQMTASLWPRTQTREGRFQTPSIDLRHPSFSNHCHNWLRPMGGMSLKTVI